METFRIKDSFLSEALPPPSYLIFPFKYYSAHGALLRSLFTGSFKDKGAF